MLIYFLTWNLLYVPHFCLTSCLCFYQFRHSCLYWWRERCVSGCYERGRIARYRRRVRAKLKATSQQERIHPWKQHFENLLGKLAKVTHEQITKIISNQVDVKLGQFMQELVSVLRKIKNRKQLGLMKHPQKYGRSGNSTYHQSHGQSNLDEQDMRNTAGGERTNS